MSRKTVLTPYEQQTLKAELTESLTRYGIPEHMHGAVILYILYGIQPGHFLEALMSNDLKEAFGRADMENTAAMAQWVKWFYNEAPSPCWGSLEKVEAWMEHAKGHRNAEEE